MSTTIRALAGLLVCSIVVVMWQQYRRLDLQQQIMDAQTEVNQQLMGALAEVISAQESSAELVTGLLHSQQSIQRGLSARTSEIRRMQSEVSEIRDWADRPLPDAIVRMRNRPDITGAAALNSAVPAGSAVHADSNEPENKR